MRRLAALALALAAAHAAAADGVRARVVHVGRPVLLVTAPQVSDPAAAEPRLRALVTTDFRDADIDEVADFFRRTTGADIVVDPAARLAGSPPITLAVSDMRAATALGWAVRQAGLHLGWLHGAVYISPEPVRGASTTRLYDVSDLVSPVRDFPGPELALTAPGGGGIDLFGQAGAAPVGEPPTTAEELAALIEETFGDTQ